MAEEVWHLQGPSLTANRLFCVRFLPFACRDRLIASFPGAISCAFCFVKNLLLQLFFFFFYQSEAFLLNNLNQKWKLKIYFLKKKSLGLVRLLWVLVLGLAAGWVDRTSISRKLRGDLSVILRSWKTSLIISGLDETEQVTLLNWVSIFPQISHLQLKDNSGQAGKVNRGQLCVERSVVTTLG